MIKIKQKTILLVEDEALIALSRRKQLEKEGYKVIHSLNGEQAIDLVCVKKEPVDLILMDIDLGKGLDGTETAEEILRLYEVPVLFLSSHTEKDIVEKTEKITNYGYVVKNSSFTVLDASIKMAFKLFEAKIKTETINNKLEATFNAVPDLIFEVGLDGYYYDVRSSQNELLFLPLSELLGKKVSDTLPPKSSQIIMLAIHEANEKGLSLGMQYEITVPAGKRWFEISVSRIASYSDKPHFILICHDISEHKKVEDVLINSRANMSAIIENTVDSIWAINTAYEILYANNIFVSDFYANFGVRLEPGKNLLLALPEPLRLLWKSRYDRALNNEHFEFIDKIDLDMDSIYIEVFMNPIVGNDKVIGASFFGRDITRRKQEEEALLESESKFSTIFKTLQYPAVIINTENGCCIDANDAMIRKSGYSHNELTEKSGAQLGMITPATEAETKKKIAELGHFTNLKFEITTKSGEIRHGVASGQILTIKNHNYLFQTISDITERKIAEQKMKKLLAEKEIILKEVHHRIKNNMNTIAALLSMQADQINHETSSILKYAEGQVQSMMVLYDKLYRLDDVSKLSLKEYLPSLIEEIVGIFSRSVKIESHIEDIVLDAKLLSSLGIIINELITNSMKYAFNGNEGLIKVHASITGNLISLEYQDDGIGLSESVTFENPVGFGLELIQMLVEQIDGTIRIERGNGTKFVLEFSV